MSGWPIVDETRNASTRLTLVPIVGGVAFQTVHRHCSSSSSTEGPLYQSCLCWRTVLLTSHLFSSAPLFATLCVFACTVHRARSSKPVEFLDREIVNQTRVEVTVWLKLRFGKCDEMWLGWSTWTAPLTWNRARRTVQRQRNKWKRVDRQARSLGDRWPSHEDSCREVGEITTGPTVLGDLMAPDLEKKRQELRRTSCGTLDPGHEHFQMLLQLRCAGNALIEPYRRGKPDSPVATGLFINIQ